MIMVKTLVNIYRKLPVKPFRGTLGRLYKKYKSRMRNRVVVATRDNLTYELNLNELIDSSIYFDGCFEPKTVAILNKYVRPGMTVLDIGANMGCHAVRLAKLVGQSGKVIAFEPMSFAFNKLRRNLELNNFSNVVAEKIALSSENKGNQAVSFYASWPLEDRQRNELHPVHGGSSTEDVAELITLDSYVQRKGPEKIDFIKLDVDGFEYKVIKGGMNTLKQFKPVMIVEFGRYTLKESGDSLEALIDLLSSLGYSFYSQDDFKEYDSRDSLLKAVPDDATINVLCRSKATPN